MKNKIRIVFKDNNYMSNCGYDHMLECDTYILTNDNRILIVITDNIETYYPMTSILFFEDSNNLRGR